MILLAFLLFGLGAADAIGVRVGRGSGASSIAVGVGVGVLMVFSCGIEWWCASAVVVAVFLWRYATAQAAQSPLAGILAVLALGGAVVGIVALGPTLPSPRGVAVEWYDSLPYEALADVSFTTFALVIGASLFLIETSNVIVRLALRAEHEVTSSLENPAAKSGSSAEIPARSTFPFGRRKPTVAPVRDDDVVKLKGGRYIGPIERLFLLVLILAGQFGVATAIVAAKGIIRFPEISKDTKGSKAEYFLVGSFTSWALVVALSLLIGLSPLKST